MSNNTLDNDGESSIQRWVNKSIRDSDALYSYLFKLTIVSIVLVSLYPFYYLFVVAVTPSGRTTDIGLLPAGLDFTSFIEVFHVIPFHRYVINSLIIATLTTLVVLSLASIAGYVFGRLEFPAKRPLFLLILVISYFPSATFLIALFRLLTGNVSVMGLTSPDLFNTPGAVVVPVTALTLPFAVFLLTIFYSQIPDGLEDAARVTGTSRLGALYRVIMPLSAPGLVTAGVLTFISAYNEFFFSFLMVDGSAENWSPIVWGLFNYQGQYSAMFDLMAAASLVGILPVAVLVLFAQKKIVSGLTAGSIKG